jgi:hypothetical protein
VVNFKRRRFYTGRKPRYPFYRRLSGLQSQSGGFEEAKNLFSPAGIRTPDRPARILVSARCARIEVEMQEDWHVILDVECQCLFFILAINLMYQYKNS